MSTVIDPPVLVAETERTLTTVSATSTGVASRRRRHMLLAAGLLVALAALVVILFMSVAYGSKQISFGRVVDSFLHYDSTLNDHLIIRTLRIPRTAVGLM